LLTKDSDHNVERRSQRRLPDLCPRSQLGTDHLEPGGSPERAGMGHADRRKLSHPWYAFRWDDTDRALCGRGDCSL